MEIEKDIVKPIEGAGKIVWQSFWAVLRDPQILLYILLAPLVVSGFGTLIGGSIFAHWYYKIFVEANTIVPHRATAVIGLVAFTAFYTLLITGYFTVAISASLLAKLDGQPTRPLQGFIPVFKRFLRVTSFTILAPFMFLVGVYSQKRKLHGFRNIIGIIGGSLGLTLAQLAPEIVSTNKAFTQTVRDALTTLGKKWKVSLVIKIAMYILFTIFIVMPKVLQHGFSPTASNVGWILTLEIGASSFAIFKILNSIFTTVLYHQAKNSK